MKVSFVSKMFTGKSERREVGKSESCLFFDVKSARSAGKGSYDFSEFRFRRSERQKIFLTENTEGTENTRKVAQ